VVLNVTDIAHVQFGPRKVPPRELCGGGQRLVGFRGNRRHRFTATEVKVRPNGRPFVKRYWLAILKLLVIAKELRVRQMERLSPQRVGVRAEVEVGEEQRVKCDLTEGIPGDANIPNGVRAPFDAMAKRAKAGFELAGYKTLEGFDHRALIL
jgi:hypothetical protein